MATILLQIEDIMFQSYEEIAKVKRDVREYIDKRQNLQLGDGDNFPCTSLFIFSEIEEYVRVVTSVLGYSTERRDKSRRAFAPAIVLARKYGIIDLISRAILPEVIELGVLLTRVSVTETEIVKAPPNGQIVDACLHSANICISTIISFFEKLSNLQAFPTMITRCELYTAASIPITVDWELLLSRLGELGDESDGSKNKSKKQKRHKIDFENANDCDYWVKELENRMMQDGWNILGRSFRRHTQRRKSLSDWENARCLKIWVFLCTKSALTSHLQLNVLYLANYM